MPKPDTTEFYKVGLSSHEVELKRQAGLSNAESPKITKTNGEIIRDNVCTLFNLLNFIIAVCLALVGAYSNMFFILIIVLNISIGIFQEISAKNLVEKLSLLSRSKTKVIRDEAQSEVALECLVKGDAVIFESGDQIGVDSIIGEGEVEVDESLLTGEADPVFKKTGDMLLSGSFIISGKCYATVKHIGNENYATKIANSAKKHKKINSELLASIRKVTKITAFLIIPLGVILFLQAYLFRMDHLNESVISTAAALLGMLPKGLVLLISIALATGVIKLSKKKILVQELYAIETLAHVDVLCLDKTGTITEGKMSVRDVTIFSTMNASLSFEEAIGNFLFYSDDNNATFSAIKNHYASSSSLNMVEKIPFSSQRKWSAVTFEGIGTLVVGAPERFSNTVESEKIAALQKDGARVLFAGFTTATLSPTAPLPEILPVAGIVLTDPIRKDAKEVMKFFENEGVALKIISGDHPETVAVVAKRAGMHGDIKCIDMSLVTTDEELLEAAANYNVFGRVSPPQKKALVQAFQKQDHTVAMTGDGVNDILALREADCSIAVGSGSDAARQVSQFVLLDSDFSVFPDALREGRRVVNNSTRVAGVFFVKTVYSLLLSLFCLFANLPFPFIPIQITLIDLAIEGYPSFFMSFEPDNRKVTEPFLRTVLRRATPNAIVILLAVLITSGITPSLGLNADQTQTIQYCLTGFVGILAVFKASYPFNKLRIFLCVTMTVGFYFAAFLFHDLLELSALPQNGWMLLGIAALVCIVLERIFSFIINRGVFAYVKKKNEKSGANIKRIRQNG